MTELMNHISKAGFPDIMPQSVRGPRSRIMKFLSAVDLRKGPVERSVTTMVRLRAPDWSTKKHERREFLYYEETWQAKNWLGVPINPVSDHIEGKYTEVLSSLLLKIAQIVYFYRVCVTNSVMICLSRIGLNYMNGKPGQ
jgi:hypothetical protein